jgi:hypothetical protein
VNTKALINYGSHRGSLTPQETLKLAIAQVCCDEAAARADGLITGIETAHQRMLREDKAQELRFNPWSKSKARH